MNCPECNYPVGKHPLSNYKGIYSADRPCDLCGFVETNEEILSLILEEKALIAKKANLADLIQRAYEKRKL